MIGASYGNSNSTVFIFVALIGALLVFAYVSMADDEPEEGQRVEAVFESGNQGTVNEPEPMDMQQGNYEGEVEFRFDDE